MSHLVSRRRYLGLMATGAGMVVLSACAGAPASSATTVPEASTASTPAAAEPSAAATEKVKITFWSSYSGANGEAETELVKRFNESHDDVEVDYQFQGSYEECAQKVTAALQAGTAPEISVLSDVWWFKFYLNQVLIPLDDMVEVLNIDLNDYHDSLINEGLRQGKHYWIPFARSTPLFYYNKEQWEAAGLPDRGPETWDEFNEWAPALVQYDGDEMKVSAFAHPDGASYLAWLFQPVAWQFGGKYSDPDFTMHFGDEDIIRAGQYYSDTIHTLGWARPSKDVGVDFVNGLTAATMMSTGSLGGVRQNMTVPFGTALLPKEKYFGCCTGGAGISILTNTPEEKRLPAMEYIIFASSTESTVFWSQSTGYMPVRKSSLESADMQAYFEEFPQFKTATEQLALTQPQDAARVFVPNGDQIIGKGLERITVQDDEVAVAFADLQVTMTEEAAPIVEALRAVEG